MILKANNKILVFGIVLVAILNGGHAFQTIFPEVTYLLIPIAAVLLMFMLVSLQNVRISRKQVILIVFLIMIASTMILYWGSDWYFYVILLCNIIIAYVVSQLYSFRTMVQWYLKISTFTTVIALIGYFLVQNTSFFEGFPIITNVNNREYCVTGVFNYMVAIPERNCGMFWEPGLFATNLVISIVFEVMSKPKASIFRLLLFTAGIFTANSSAGFALWFLCVLLLFVKNITPSKSVITNVCSVVILILGIGVVLNFNTILEQTGLDQNLYFEKLRTDNISESSRAKAITHNLHIFLSAPIFGAGIEEVSAQIDYVADTSTSTYLLSVFGLLGSIYTIGWGVNIFRNVRTNILAKVLLVTIVMVILNKEPHHKNLITWCIFFFLTEKDFASSKSPLDHKGGTLQAGDKANEY